jgi:predicted NBD/HSP70 family sugar kinase
LDRVHPKFVPPLDADFRPAALFNRVFREEVAESGGGVPLAIALERAEGCVTRIDTSVFPEEHPSAPENLFYAERLFKFLLWQCGGWKAYIAGPARVYEHLCTAYSGQGKQAFDAQFMGDDVYQKPFTVVQSELSQIPAANEKNQSLGRHLDGCRVGVDLGASDLKVSAVIEGQSVFSEEIIWEPRKQADPNYHYEHIWAAIQRAADKMPRVDAIGVSAAGIYIDNRAMIASLYRSIPKDRFDEIREMFNRIGARMGVPLIVINDGEVTALAGSMWLDDYPILGLALGSSEAAGYVNPEGSITTWLNELAFAPIDYNAGAPVDEWSGDRGCGAAYFSQQCVFRLLSRAGIEIPAQQVDAEKLKFVQEKLESGHEGAARIWQTMGIYMGYGIASYAEFYPLKHVLLLGRCTSGSGGPIILEQARRVLAEDFPQLSARLTIHLPDERSRRVGQSVAAASLPFLAK